MAEAKTARPKKDGSTVLPIGRIRPAYEQVANQLHELIVAGTLKEGDRLPPLPELATMFGVGRSTAREALRLLSAQDLLISVRGASGGTFVKVSDTDAIGRYLEASIGLLSGNARISLDELLEARRILEVPAAGLAAERATPAQLEQLADAIDFERGLLDRGERGRRYERTRGFHYILLAAGGNRLLEAMTGPVFRVVQLQMSVRVQSPDAWSSIDAEHDIILDRIRARDVNGAADAMQLHVSHLKSLYIPDVTLCELPVPQVE